LCILFGLGILYGYFICGGGGYDQFCEIRMVQGGPKVLIREYRKIKEGENHITQMVYFIPVTFF